MSNMIGQTFGRYQITGQLGEGGMAVVYKAFDTRLENDVAVKVIRTENLPQSGVEKALKRFEREAKALAKLTHPNIVKVSDYGEYEGSPYLVMPYLPGGTLKQVLNGRPMPWQDAAQLLIPIARALDYAHRQNMIHRDVKPSNILITEDGEPMLTDFGIAKIIDEEATVDLTGTSATVGTPEYMAPEQVISKTVDHRADIYALGVVFYEMITGRRPFVADTPMAVLFKHASEPLPNPRQFVPDLPSSVEMVLLRALAKKPEERFERMEEFASTLARLIREPVAPAPVIQPRRDDRTAVDLPASIHHEPARVQEFQTILPESMPPPKPKSESSPGQVPPSQSIARPVAPPIAQKTASGPKKPSANSLIVVFIGLTLFGFLAAGVAGVFLLSNIGKEIPTRTPVTLTEAVASTGETQSTPTQAAVEPAAPPTATSLPAPNGAWVDEIHFSSIDQADQAAAQLKSGDIDVYAYSVADPGIFKTISQDASLGYSNSLGSYTELTFNPSGPKFSDGRLNPFSNAKIRAAMNMLIDRDYIAQEIYGGLAKPRYTAVNSAFVDYVRYVDTIRSLEVNYGYDPGAAKQIITAEMKTMGASVGSNGKFTYNGSPVKIIFLIRTEDNRKIIGDYVANQLEDLGFTVDRQYKTRSEASPIWNRSDPQTGQWHLYTGGWITTAISRDDGTNFAYFYTPLGGGSPLWQAYKPSSAFKDVAEKLWNNQFNSLAERDQLFIEALTLSMEDSSRLWLIDQISFSPFRSNIAIAYDLAGGISGTQLWPFTARFTDQIGGTLKIAQPGILVEPWNPVAGSNWIYDTMPRRATEDYGTVSDPYTGLAWPQRIEKAEITVLNTIPVTQTLDWVTLRKTGSITVPKDAWVDWDAQKQTFITVGQKYPQGLTALTKRVVTYPADLFTRQEWHDGSPLSVADFVMGMIMTFDRAKPASAIYDESSAYTLESFMSVFKGVRIISTTPLIIETYSDAYSLDAELMATDWWPQYGYGQAPWHNIAIGIKAETAKDLAFSTDKAADLKIEWMSFISGPSLAILQKELTSAAAQGYIPYATTLGKYITAADAKNRYANLQKWYNQHGHFWVGTGPFYLDRVYTTESSLAFKRNTNFSDKADRWMVFAEPMIPEVTLNGPASIKIGSQVDFQVQITFKGQPYPSADIQNVKYLVFDPSRQLLTSGTVIYSSGAWKLSLTPEQTKRMKSGAYKLEIAVVSSLVTLPAFGTWEFVVKP